MYHSKTAYAVGLGRLSLAPAGVPGDSKCSLPEQTPSNEDRGMADVFSREKRSQVMSRIRGKNTKPEKVVRSFLHRHGFRFRLHQKNLPGKPDIVLPKYRYVVFVHGCFWHHHPGCGRATLPSSHRAFWTRKIEGNRERDLKHLRELRRCGWRVLTVWECQTRKPETLRRELMPLLEMKA